MPCNAGGRSAAGLFESRRRRRSSHGASGRRRVRSVTVSGLRLRGNPALATALPGGIARAIVVSHYTSPLKGKQNKWYNLVTSRASESMLLEKGFGSHGLARGPVPSPSSGEKKPTLRPGLSAPSCQLGHTATASESWVYNWKLLSDCSSARAAA